MSQKNGQIIVDKDPKTKGLKRLMPIETYLAEYVDGSGKPQTRVVFRVPGDDRDLSFVMQDRISGTLVATQASKWFENDMNKAFKAPKRKPRASKAMASV